MVPVLAGQVALVTGGGSGIGAACARVLARCGAQVVVADKSAESAQQVAREIGQRAHAVTADVTSPTDTANMVAAAVGTFGRLSIAVNNAGVSVAERLLIADVSDDAWERVIKVNLDGVFFSMRAEIPALISAGGGSVINISSMFGTVAMPGGGPYVASKHAVVGLTRAAALDYADRGLRFNSVGPGFIRTPLLSGRGESDLVAVGELHPIGRIGEPEDVAELVAFLASAEADFITGAHYAIDGGYTAQ